jgi:hypothetical protein
VPAEQVDRALDFLRGQWLVEPPATTHPSEEIERIYAAATSGRWRRTSVDADSSADIRGKIGEAVRSGSALEFSIPFGGYKSWKAQSYPGLNWADVFAVNYLARYAASVAAIYPGQVCLTFTYVSQVMDIVNNMPLEDQGFYVAEFQSILAQFNLPTVQVRLFDIGTLFPSIVELRSAVIRSYHQITKQWDTLPRSVTEKRIASARRNFMIRGAEDFGHLSDHELDQKVVASAMLCEALDRLPERRTFNKFSNRIQLVNVSGPRPSIHVSSCDTSANHFGVGTGIVEVREHRCLQRIATEQTWNAMRDDIVLFEVLDEVAKGFAGLRTGSLVASEGV